MALQAGIIYTDIENYTVNSTCSPLVQAYVDGFVSEIHVYSGYLAGVYANSGPINADISTASTPPDDIWITKTTSSTKPQVTVWNQGISDTLWPNNQRIHQFVIDQTGVTFGGVAFSPSVDEDLDNGPVLNANAGVKTHSSYVYTSIDCTNLGAFLLNNNTVQSTFQYPGAIQTGADGINDFGQVVGWYKDSNQAYHGFIAVPQ